MLQETAACVGGRQTGIQREGKEKGTKERDMKMPCVRETVKSR